MNARSPFILAALLLVVAAASACLPLAESARSSPLRDAFHAGTAARSQRSQDAKALSRLLHALAEMLQHDAQSAQPKLARLSQVDLLRITSRELAFAGQSLTQRYPRLPEVLGARLAAATGTEDAPLDDSRRAQLIHELHALADECAHIANTEVFP